MLAALEGVDADAMLEALTRDVGGVAQDGAKQGLKQVAAGADDLDELLSLANERAVDWAGDHAGKLITSIDETTRMGAQALVLRALDEGWSNDELADALMESPLFGESRSMMIARTETAFADVQGNVIGWQESGVVAGRQWTIGTDQIEICDDCQEMDEQIVGIDDQFDGGDPPLHPNCRCDVLPILVEDEADEELEPE